MNNAIIKTINVKGELISLERPLVMGILNVTPDSFYESSRCVDVQKAIERAKQIIDDGGDIIDVGAYSSRPGAEDVSEEEEIARLRSVLPLIRERYPDTIISVDTFRSRVARFVVEECGVDMINDIMGGEGDEDMFETVAQLKVPYILMHMRGTPQTMQKNTEYGNIMVEMITYFSEKIEKLRLLGVNDVILDPGFGFAKSLAQNYNILKNLADIAQFKLPLLVGVSRKSMIYRPLNISPEESLIGTVALNTLSLTKGADILRVHDVKECVETIKIFELSK
ncbi:MAG: dihydropteroate synthase [Muribaculaceae bacterium]|nr:dihydropteroate synthase [Muribaculaceae bacterium]